jgi:exopolysaccharide production protein ExoY
LAQQLPEIDVRSRRRGAEAAVTGEDADYVRTQGRNAVESPRWLHAPVHRAGRVEHLQFEAPLSEAEASAAAPIGGSRKRCFDIIAAIGLILLLIPLILLVAAAIKLADRGPVLFRHRRIGRNGKPFYCLKFRTMAVNAEDLLQRHLACDPEAAREWAADHKLRRDPRITSLGHGLRKTSLDELPQLLNIVMGDMSLVGPRPIVAAEIPKYGEAIGHYYSARPGLTGAWQVSGRNDVDYSRRVMFDKQYVEQWNFSQDLLIVAKTVRVVLTSRGSY